MTSIYLIGSLRNEQVPRVAAKLRCAGYEVFDDWYAAGPRADDHWQEYEDQRGHTYDQALAGYAARHVFEFDKAHLERCDMGVLLMPAGKSGHLELGYMAGLGKRTFIYMDKQPERYDVMYQFATGGVHFDFFALVRSLGGQL
jgi:nucleoside 2-deoxyribosyltransferase